MGGAGRDDNGGEGLDAIEEEDLKVEGGGGFADRADARAFAAIACALALASATICAGLFLGGGGCIIIKKKEG